MAILMGVCKCLIIFICISLVTCDVDNFFMFICHVYIISGEVSVKVFDPFFNQVVFSLSFKSSLYILDKVLYQL